MPHCVQGDLVAKRLLSYFSPLLLPAIIALTPLLTTVSPALADDDEDYFEELEPPRPKRRYEESTWRKSGNNSSKKRLKDSEEERDDEDDENDEDDEEHSVLHRILWYLPNRLLDVADIARARVRVGPGVALNAHVTKVVQAGLGSYMSVYGGLPGPRQRRRPRLPLGVEAYSGGALSLAEASFETGYEPEYSPTEVGASIHFIIFGLDVGVDPLEIVDLVTGIVGVDIGKDDY